MARLRDLMTAGLGVTMLIIVFTLVVGQVNPFYDGTVVNNSFADIYDRSDALLNQSEIIKDAVIKEESAEGDVLTSFNVLDAFGILKAAFLDVPRILINIIGIIIGTPTDESSGGIFYIFAGSIGIPPILITLMIALATMAIIFLVYQAVVGGRGT